MASTTVQRKTFRCRVFLTISGHTYCRVLSGEDDGPLKYYIYDPTYTRDTQLKPETLRIVRECIAAKNNLAKVLKQFGGRSDIEQLIVCIESIPADIQAPDFAGLYIRPKGDVTTSPRKLVIYPTKQSFQDAHPDLDEAKGQNGLFVPTSNRLYEALLYPSFAIGGTADPGWDSTLFSPTTGKRLLCSNTQGAEHSQSSGSKMVADNTDAPTPGVASRIQRGSHKPKVDFIGHLIAHSASDVYRTSGSSIVTVALRMRIWNGHAKIRPYYAEEGPTTS